MLTLILAFVFIVLALAGLAIGWLITGRAKITSGSCGKAPQQPRSKECGQDTSCSLCQSEDKKSDVQQTKPRDDSGDVQ